MAFDEHKKLFFSDDLKYRVVAPAMIPMEIYRNDENDEARLIEQNMSEKLNKQSAKLQEANDAINKKTSALAYVLL